MNLTSLARSTTGAGFVHFIGLNSLEETLGKNFNKNYLRSRHFCTLHFD